MGSDGSVRGVGQRDAETQSVFTAMTTYLGYAVLFVFGHLRDAFARITGRSRYYQELTVASKDPGYTPLVYPSETFYVRRLFNRIQDCWNRPVASRPGAWIDIVERTSEDGNKTLKNTQRKRRCLNLGSYNYLGFADDWDSTCGESVRKALDEFGVSCCSTSADAGYTLIHEKLERTVARFVGKPAAVVFNMGYATNSLSIPAIMGPGSLIVSDKLNHTSIVNGCRSAQARTIPFKHNDVDDLEKVLRKAIVEGQPSGDGTHVPWKKILVMVEGIYSMEGEICRLREVVDIAKRYKAYVYVDEAHSIGALGKTGRGVCEHTGVDPSEIDILMGTFTKSFGGMGGYIAASEEIVSYVKASSAGCTTANSMSPTVCQQVLTALTIIMGEDNTNIGRQKLERIKSNSNFFRSELKRIGCSVLGDEDSPVIPVMLFHPTKIAAFSRECYARGLASVVVGFPAVPIHASRARFCISAAHDKEDLRQAIKKIKEVCKILNLRYERSAFG